MKPIRVLIVDDSAVMRKIVERSLRQAGIELQEDKVDCAWLRFDSRAERTITRGGALGSDNPGNANLPIGRLETQFLVVRSATMQSWPIRSGF